MAFLKYANASVVHPAINAAAWDHILTKSLASASSFDNRKATSLALQEYDPKQYMLSHCTIVASVDVDDSKLPLGRQMYNGVQIDRRFSDYLIKPECSRWVNNNFDAWDRKLLLGSYKTFIGAENYCEHLQIPELSKGKIIDAAARDIGDSVYIDILVATERKHKPLIAAIQSKQLRTLSMGAQVEFTQCSKCGNVAADETQLCSCIRYEKGNSFIDGLGKTRKIAELCGHHSVPGSNKFIEASWVASPAFTGAVLRSILSPEEGSKYTQRIQTAFSQPTQTIDPNAYQKAARFLGGGTYFDVPTTFKHPARNVGVDVSAAKIAFGFDEEEESTADATPPKEEDPFDKAVEDLANALRDKAVERVRGEMAPPEKPRADSDENRNDTLIKEAVTHSTVWRRIAQIVLAQVKNPPLARRVLSGLLLHKSGGWKAVKTARLSGLECLAVSRLLDTFQQVPRIAGEARIYRTVVAVGGAAAYRDSNGYLAACRRYLGRELTGSEKDALLTKGRIFDQ